MNILFINRMMATAWGGGENYDYNLACGLRELGHSVIFLSGRRPGTPAVGRIGDVEMLTVETPFLRRHMYQLAGKIRRLPGLFGEADRRLFQWRIGGLLDRLLSERNIDLVQVLNLPFLAETLAARGLPVAMRFPGPPAWFYTPGLRRFDCRGRTAVFSHGDTVRVLRDKVGIAAHEVPPGVAGDLYRPAAQAGERLALRERLGLRPEDFVVVTVGRLIHGKGHDFLLDGLPEMVRREPRLRLLLVGDGAFRSRLEEKARRLGVAGHTIFTGHLPKEGVAGCLSAADLFCLLSEYENYSNATLEAMSAGLPVIASRVGGFPLQVRDGENGYLVDHGDLGALADRTARIATNNVLRRELSEGARRFVSGFSWAASAQRVEGIYDEVLAA